MALSEEAFNQIMSTASLDQGFQGMSLTDDKRNKISSASLEKQANLGMDNQEPHSIAGDKPLMQGNDLGKGYSVVDGQNVFNKNKIINNMNQDQMGSYMSDVYDQSIRTDEEGRDYQLGDFNTETRDWDRHYLENQNESEGYLYAGHGKQDPNLTKWGYASLGGEERYTPGMARDAQGNQVKTRKGVYGWESGAQGIDPTDLAANWRLPEQVAKDAEGVLHGNRGMIARRDMFDDGSPESIARRKELGGGASEYYKGDKDSPLYSGMDGEAGDAKTVKGVSTTMDVDKIKKGLPKGASRKQRNEAILANLLASDSDSYSSRDGRAVSLGKGIVAGGFNIITNILDTSLEAAAWAGEKAGVISEEQKKIVGELADSDLDAWNEFMNVNTQYVDAANKELADSVEKGNYIDAAWSVLKNLDVHLAQSAPEMGALALKVPGLIAAVNSRVGEVSEEFAKNRGREPTAAEEAGMWATSAAVLVPEKFLMVGPIKAIFKSSKAAAKGTSKAKGFMNKMNKSFDDLEGLIPQGKTLGGSAKAIGMTAGGEIIQEVADQAQETYWKEGRMLTADEAITAGIAGGVMGGALKGVGEAKNVAKTGKETLRKHQLNKNVSNMSKEDIALRKEDAKEMMAENDRNIEGSQKAHDEVGEAKTFEDLVNSDNKDISNKAKEERLAIAKDKDFYKRNDIQKEMKENLSLLNEARRKRVTNDLKLEETASDTEILEASTKAGENISPLLLQANVKKEIIDAEMNSNLDATKKSMQEGFIQAGVQNKHNKKQTQSQIDELSQVRQTQGKKGNVSGRKTGTIDVSEKALNEQTATGSTLKKMSTAGFEILKNITGQGSTVNRRVNTELDKYDNESIRKAMKTAGKDSNIERLGQKILDKRRSADEYKKEGIQGDETYFERDSKKKGANFQKLKKLVSQGSLSNQQEKDYIHKAIDEIEKRGDINKKQATIMRNRLNKNKVGSKADTNDLANKKLFRDSNDVQADMDKVDDQIIDLDEKDKGSGANQKKIETLANIRASLARELAQELKYEKDNNITPEPAQVVPETKAEPEVEPESKEEAKEEAEPKEETKEPEEASEKKKEESTEETVESQEDLEPKNKNAAGTNFTEAELNGADPVSDGYEEGGTMTEAELKKLIEC